MNNLIKDIPKDDRPRERFLKYGASSLSNNELLSIIINNGTKNMSVMEVSNNILKSIDSINDLESLTINKLKNIKGVGEVKAIKLLSALELGKRVYYKEKKNIIKMNSADKVFSYLKNELQNKKQEYFIALYLDSKKNLIIKKELFIGTINKSIVHPREIFKNAYLYSAESIICVHNHPSGDPMPSKEDIILTKHLVEISKIQGINIIDHIIIGDNYYSFYENGDI